MRTRGSTGNWIGPPEERGGIRAPGGARFGGSTTRLRAVQTRPAGPGRPRNVGRRRRRQPLSRLPHARRSRAAPRRQEPLIVDRGALSTAASVSGRAGPTQATRPAARQRLRACTSPPNRLCRKRIDLTVLVDRDDQPLLRVPTRQPAQQEIQPVPAYDHRLHTAPSLDPKALRRPTRQVRIERRRPHVGPLVADHRRLRNGDSRGGQSLVQSTATPFGVGAAGKRPRRPHAN
jgi:hypothetical protein